MSNSALSDAPPDSHDTSLTPEGIMEWRLAVQAFFAETLVELQSLTAVLQSQARAQRAPSEAAARQATEAESYASPQPSLPRFETHDKDSPHATTPDNSQHRLAELARRIEERLQRSESQK